MTEVGNPLYASACRLRFRQGLLLSGLDEIADQLGFPPVRLIADGMAGSTLTLISNLPGTDGEHGHGHGKHHRLETTVVPPEGPRVVACERGSSPHEEGSVNTGPMEPHWLANTGKVNAISILGLAPPTF